jgi:hypothetical protein
MDSLLKQLISDRDISVSWRIDYEPSEYIYDGTKLIKFDYKIKNNIEIIVNSQEELELDCCICMETKNEYQIGTLNCSHKFCNLCIAQQVANSSISSCPLCRTIITHISVQHEHVRRQWFGSKKIYY